ncbi:MAG: hypothetical protein WCD00_12450 [Desulfuromonadaceae bacterium]
MCKRSHFIAGGCVLVLILLLTTVRVRITGHFEGIFLLQKEPFVFILQDDVRFGDEEKLLCSLLRPDLLRWLRERSRPHAAGQPYLEYDWHKRDGSGFVRNFSGTGQKLLTCLSRFVDSEGKTTEGVFVGGGLPPHARGDDRVTNNETGMAYYDGHRWFHLWCNVNESINSATAPFKSLFPSTWEFLGSQVLFASDWQIVLRSRHRVVLDGVPLMMDRHAIFLAGEPYFILSIKITNGGTLPVRYHYLYGDEPWLGDFGSSRGNVGWVRDRLYLYEGPIDTGKYTYAGMFDSGNPVIGGQRGDFTGVANFIEWMGDNRPEQAYFSNSIGRYAPEDARVPLDSPDNRVIFLQWGPRALQPGQSETYTLAIGMAAYDEKSGLPSKPPIMLDYKGIQRLIEQKSRLK